MRAKERRELCIDKRLSYNHLNPILTTQDISSVQAKATKLLQKDMISYAFHFDEYHHKAINAIDIRCWSHVLDVALD